MAGAIVKIGAGAAVLLLAVFFLQDGLIFHPPPAGPAPSAASVFIDSEEGARLHAWHVPGPPGAPLVLYFGGNAEDVSWMVAEASRRAPEVAWLLVDYRGYGRSEGKPSEPALVSDALRWYDHASRESQRIYLFGRSLGSGVAVQLAAARQVEGVILVAPFDSLVALGQRHYPFLPVRWMLKHRFDSERHAPAISAPLLCLVAEQDAIIPIVHSKRLYEAWKGPKRWVELAGAGHNSTDHAPQFWSAIREFLGQKQ